jgi:hypothetical protein
MFGLGNTSASNTKIFYPTTGVNGQGYQIWRKPVNASMIWFTILSGGGGGGGGGCNNTVGAAGGGSGACSNITKFMCPAILLPNELYVQVGVGGAGGASGSFGGNGSNGGNGINSFILTSPRTATLPNIILYSGVNAPGGGGGGGAGGGSAPGGTVPTIPLTQPWYALGTWSTTVGLIGVDGVGTANGANAIAWNAFPLSPGASGGGFPLTKENGGGSVVNSNNLTDLGTAGYYTSGSQIAAGGITGSASIYRNGSSGKKSMSPFLNSGGAGGASISGSSIPSGNGGAGGWGCGGGGGGSTRNSTGNQGGSGGNGGDGLVIISWV